jgi:hypothetical protein
VEIRHIEPDNAHEIDALAARLGNTARGINAASPAITEGARNKKPRRGARRVAMRPLKGCLFAWQGEKIQAWTTKNACGY